MNKNNKITRSSRGKCQCQSLYQCHGCGGYQPSQDKFCPAMCAYLDRADLVTCRHKEEKSFCA